MIRIICRLAILVLCAAAIVPFAGARAQWVASGASRPPPPLYPYELQPGQSYAVEVAPGTYVIHRPSEPRGYPAAQRGAKRIARRHEAAAKPKHTHANRALIEELRRRDARRSAKEAAKQAAKQAEAAKRAPKRADAHTQAGRKPDQVIHTRKVVREKPIVIETRRIVNDPPTVITRRHYVDDLPPPRPFTGSVSRKQAGNDDPRVIHADAEITILGPDRMSIRLVRRDGQRLDADAGGAPPR